MNKDSLIVNKGVITIMLDNKNGFPVDRKKGYLKAICEILNTVETNQIWDVFMITQTQVLEAMKDIGKS